MSDMSSWRIALDHGPKWGTFVMALMGRELLAFPIWLYAICGNEIDWRGEKYKILWGGEVGRVQNTRQHGGVVGRLAAGVLGKPSRGSYEPLLSNDP